jgi:methionyl-tRNA formyltransferase
MRKILIASAVALLAFATQAAAGEAVATFAPQLAQTDYRIDGDSDSNNQNQNQLWAWNTWPALLFVGGTIGIIALLFDHNDNSKSA